MAVAIYKPEQGYWVRMLTAVFAGTLVLAGAAWAWQQMAAVQLPEPRATVTFASATGTPTVGEAVELFRPGDDDVLAAFGTARVASVTGDGRTPTVVLEGFDIDRDLRGDTAEVRSASVGGAPGSGAVGEGLVVQGFVGQVAQSGGARSVVGIPVLPQAYLQAGVALLIILGGAVLIYWHVALRRPSVEFLIATDGEMKKVNWTSFKEIRGSTIVVIVASFLIAAVIFGIDFGFQALFTAIRVLEV